MNRKYIGIVIIVLGILAIFLILYFLFFFDFNKAENIQDLPEQNEQANIMNLPKTTEDSSVVEEEPRRSVTKRELNEADLAKMASSFAERFGSYSNHSNFGNIRDLKIFMTKKMQIWADRFISDQVKDNYSDIYFGVTTKSISTETKNFDESEGLASMLVKTQRRESTGSTNNISTYYQDISIMFTKENGSWKVDGATWQ